MIRRVYLERGECCGNECRYVNYNFFNFWFCKWGFKSINKEYIY